MDPHSDAYSLVSPYSWASNNPISIIDPDGKDILLTGAAAQSYFAQLQHEVAKANSPRQSASERQINVDNARGTASSNVTLSPPRGRGFSVKRSTPGKVFTKNWKMPNPLERPVDALGWLLWSGVDLLVNVSSAIPPESDLIPGPMAIVGPNRMNHIFGKSEHALESLIAKFGSQEEVFDAVQRAANQALKEGKLTPNAKGILPSGDLGNIITVDGMNVRLIGGRVENERVIISSFSRKGL